MRNVIVAKPTVGFALPYGSLAPRGERVRVRDICVARLFVAPHILIFGTSENSVPHPPLEDERRHLPTWGEAIHLRAGPDTVISIW